MSSYIGIDLGTTNSAIAYIRPEEAGETEFPPVQIQPVPQLVAENREEPFRTLPSFLFLGESRIVGVYARELGALTPTRLIHSAKSWLSNSAVDRTAKILPWEAGEAGRVMSPVEVSTQFLTTIRDAWNRTHPERLETQPVVLTVPASFDEEARELTVQAAHEAGIERLTLLEEPAAAFYSWIANHLAESRKALFDGMTVLICDVGGGTSDFTIIRVSREGDRIDFTRTAVGRHLLLGGDNLDLTVAWLAESKLNTQLSLRQRSALRRQCAAAKERLLGDNPPGKVEITILGAGRTLIGGTLRTEILREEVLELALEGFLPFCELSSKLQREEMSPFRETGLPYETDPAITRHLAAFLTESQSPPPDAILFNGGFFIPEVLRARVTDVVERWYGRRPLVLENRDLDLAVAAGASYYNYVRSTGAGLIVRGGLPRAYYIGLEGGDGVRGITIVPRGTNEGETLELEVPGLQLLANKPVSFRLYSSLTRIEDKLGDIVEFSKTDLESGLLHQHAPLYAVIRFGKPGAERYIPIQLGARLTEVGTLEIWADSKVSEHRWRLEFQLRKQAVSEAPSRPAAVVSEEAVRSALELIDATFRTGTLEPEQLPSRLEQTLGLGRSSWPLTCIRTLADRFLELAEGRRRTPSLEARWLNLCGLCLRPGFGFPGDEYRIEQARRLFAAGLVFGNQVQNEIEWWIFWGRLAGGLNKNQQTDIFQRLAPILLPRKSQRVRVNTSLLREMWRCAASLELLPVGTKISLGEALLRRIAKGDYRESELWCLARLGARELFYGPANQVVPPATAALWVEKLVKIPAAAEACASIARRCGDVTRDLPPATIALVRRALEDHKDAARLIALLEGGETRDAEMLSRIFGEELPSGLVMAAS